MSSDQPKFYSGFRKRDTPIIADYRPLYKIGIVTLILGLVCIGNRASLSKLHMLVWALKSDRNKGRIQDLVKGGDQGHFVWGVEPALNKALNFGVSEGLFILKGDKYSLSKSGLALLDSIEGVTDLFAVEKSYLNELGKRHITEEIIISLTKNKLKNAQN